MSEISVGEVVQLRSGGPLMTVAWIQAGDNGQEAFCEWFIKDENKGSLFPITSLKKATQQ